MYKWINNNISLIGVAIILFVTSFFYYTENNTAPSIIIAVLIMAILSILVIDSKKIAIYSTIALAPISIPVYIEFLSLELSFPTEFITLLLVIIMGVNLFVNEKYERNILSHPISIILISDILITLASSAFSNHTLVSIKRFLLKTGFISIFYFVFSHWYTKTNNKFNFFFLYAIGLIYPIYNALKWHSYMDFSVATSFAMPKPFYSDHTIYGACLAFIVPFLLGWIFFKKHENKLMLYGVIGLSIFILIAEILSYSRASWISLLAVVLFSFLLRFNIKTTHIFLSLAIISSLLIYNYSNIYSYIKDKDTEIHTQENISDHLGSVTNLQTDASNLERINRWTCAVRMFNEKPLTGFGPGTYQFEYGQFQSVDIMTRISTQDGDRGNAHSEYLTYLSEMGIFGFLTFLALVFYSIHIGLKSYYHFKNDENSKIVIFGALCGLITFFIHGLFNSFIDSEKMAILVYGSLALLVVYDIKRKKHSSE